MKIADATAVSAFVFESNGENWAHGTSPHETAVALLKI
jgi:hypothetical protein